MTRSVDWENVPGKQRGDEYLLGATFVVGSSDLSMTKQNTPKVFTHEAGAVLAERGFDVGSLDERVDEAHLAVEQGAGLHEVVDHLLPADLSVSAREGRQQ